MSKLSREAQECVARALVREYGHLGVNLQAAREEVAQGKWDDHPAATRKGAR